MVPTESASEACRVLGKTKPFTSMAEIEQLTDMFIAIGEDCWVS